MRRPAMNRHRKHWPELRSRAEHPSASTLQGKLQGSLRTRRVAPAPSRVCVFAACALLASLAGCGKGIAGSLAPDFAGLWDITYDDSVRVEFALGEQQISARVDEGGGRVAVRDAGVALDFEVDCTRPELVCPSEVWPRELSLQKPPGKLDGDGLQLRQPALGAGFGRCVSQAGSFVTGEIMSVATAHSIRPEAVALTGGRVSVVIDAACFAPHAGLPAGTQVTLSTGFTAAKR